MPEFLVNKKQIAVITIGVLLVVSYIHAILSKLSFYKVLYKSQPWYVVESIDKLLGVAICVLAIWLTLRLPMRNIGRELGFTSRVAPAFGFGLLATSPMLVGFALTRRVAPDLSLPGVFFLTVFSPIVEEIEHRGYGFRQLLARAGWRFWWAALIPAVLFGWGHVERGQSWKEMAGIFLITGVGACTFSWLLYRWNNLWAPIALHVFMNLWWEVFSVARTAVGGWFPFTLQIVSVILAIGLTFVWTKKPVMSANREIAHASVR